MSKCYSLSLSQGSRTTKNWQFILTASITIKSYDINLTQYGCRKSKQNVK